MQGNTNENANARKTNKIENANARNKSIFMCFHQRLRWLFTLLKRGNAKQNQCEKLRFHLTTAQFKQDGLDVLFHNLAQKFKEKVETSLGQKAVAREVSIKDGMLYVRMKTYTGKTQMQ